MFKRYFLSIALILSLGVNLSAEENPELVQLSAHVYAYIGITEASPAVNGFGANCGVVIGSDAILVIDTLASAKHAQKLIEQIRMISENPIKYVVNTHSHFDHTWGNSEFAKLGAIVVGHKAIPVTAEQGEEALARAENYGLTVEDVIGTEIKLPDVLIDAFLEIDLGDVRVTVDYPGPGHTPDNITVFVNDDSVLFVGDLIFNKYHPFMGDGDIDNWTSILSDIEQSTAQIIVPGHGPRVSKSDIQDMALYINEFDKRARKLSTNKTQADAWALASELAFALPDQGRKELSNLIEMNLRTKYLPADGQGQSSS